MFTFLKHPFFLLEDCYFVKRFKVQNFWLKTYLLEFRGRLGRLLFLSLRRWNQLFSISLPWAQVFVHTSIYSVPFSFFHGFLGATYVINFVEEVDMIDLWANCNEFYQEGKRRQLSIRISKSPSRRRDFTEISISQRYLWLIIRAKFMPIFCRV